MSLDCPRSTTGNRMRKDSSLCASVLRKYMLGEFDGMTMENPSDNMSVSWKSQAKPRFRLQLLLWAVSISVALIATLAFVWSMPNTALWGKLLYSAHASLIAVAFAATFSAHCLDREFTVVVGSMICTGALNCIYFFLQATIIPDIPSIAAFTAAILVTVVTIAFASYRAMYWPLLLSLLPATLVMMYAARLRFFVEGSRYDYCGMSSVIWAEQIAMCAIMVGFLLRWRNSTRTSK